MKRIKGGIVKSMKCESFTYVAKVFQQILRFTMGSGNLLTMVGRIRTVNFVVFLVFSLSSYSSLYGQIFTVKANADSFATAYPSQRKLARTSDGTLHCVYHRKEGAYKQIFHSWSTDNGTTWTEEQITSENYDQLYPAIAVDSNDHLHVVWQGCHSGSPSKTQIRYRKYSGSWGTITNITNDTSWDQRTPSIAVDSGDNLYVVWQKVEYVGGPWCNYGCGPLWYSKFTTSWSTPIRVGEGAEYEEVYPAIAIDQNDYIHIIWATGGYRNGDCWHSAYRKYTTSWQPIESFSCYYSYNLAIATDSYGNVHCVSYHYDSGISYNKRTSSGWTGWTTIGNGTVPSIAVDSLDYLHTVWHDANGNLKYRKYTTSWQPVVNIFNDTDSRYPNFIWAYYPDVRGTKTNRPKKGFAFVWTDNTTVKFYRSDDLEWEIFLPPTVTTDSATAISSASATLYGNITDLGSFSYCDTRGFVWGTTPLANPGNIPPSSSGYSYNWVEPGTFLEGAFNYAVSSLSYATTYYFRAVVHSSAGWTYGGELSFSTLAVAPAVTTQPATDITTTTATGHGTIVSTGGAPIIQHGVCWSEFENPTLSDPHTSQGESGEGSFTSNITGLTPGRRYYYRAYATNSAGTGYGENQTFTTYVVIVVDWDNGNVQAITLQGDVAFEFTNGRPGAIYKLIIKQDTYGGHLVDWPTSVMWRGGEIPSITTSPNATDIATFVFTGENYLGNYEADFKR